MGKMFCSTYDSNYTFLQKKEPENDVLFSNTQAYSEKALAPTSLL